MKRFYLMIFVFLAYSGVVVAQADFFAVGQIQDIHIRFEQQNWRYMLDSLRYNGEELLPATVKVNNETLKGAGVRYRSGRAFTPGGRRNSLYIDLDLAGTGQQYQGHGAIDLSSALRDPSLVREVLGLEIARNYMPAPRANYARVYINDEFYGLLVNQEPVSEAFLQRHFGSSDGLLYRSDTEYMQQGPDGCLAHAYTSLQTEPSLDCYSVNYRLLQGESFEPLAELTKQLAKGEQLEDVLDIDATLWLLAFNNLVVHLNSYTGQFANNYYLYRRPDGRFVPILSDLNLAFGGFKNTGGQPSDLSTDELLQIDPLLHADNAARPLIRQLMANEAYRKVYLSHLRTMLVDHFNKDKFEKRAGELQALIRPELEKDENRYYPMEAFDSSLTETIGKRSRIPGPVEFMQKRTAWLESQPLYTVLPPSISLVGVTRRERFSSQQLAEYRIHAKVEDFANRVRLHYRYGDTGAFMIADMVDDGKHHDGAAGDGVFGAVVSPHSGNLPLQYFIEAENVKAVSYSPARYMYEQHQTTLAEINQ